MARIRTITPLSEQQPANIAANTGAVLFLPDGTRYQGVYYIVDGQFLTTPTLTDSTVVLSRTPKLRRNSDVYDRIKGDLTSLFVAPISHRPVVTPEDITNGFVQRYFVMKRNEPGQFVEISKDQYSKYGIQNQKVIDANLWQRFDIRWSIVGDRETVISNNRKAVVAYEREDNLPGLSKFLFKLDEFYLVKQ